MAQPWYTYLQVRTNRSLDLIDLLRSSLYLIDIINVTLYLFLSTNDYVSTGPEADCCIVVQPIKLHRGPGPLAHFFA